MTAEIAILNAQGIALAADSAVTIGNQKIINSALKLFSLSKTESVGIMIYGNANFLNIPWETLIKIYRHKNPKLKLKTLDKYAENFVDFLKKQANELDLEIQDQWLELQLNSILQYTKNNYIKIIDEILESGNTLSVADKKEFLMNLLLELIVGFENQEITFSGEMSPEFNEKVKLISDPIFKDFFPDFFEDEEINKELNKLTFLIITNNPLLYANTGIVIAGFGEDDLFPSVVTYDIAGCFEKNLIHKNNKQKTFINKNSGVTSHIIAFAQEDVVESFISGMDPSLLHFGYNYINTIHSEILNSFTELDPVKQATLKASLQQCSQSYRQAMIKEMVEKHFTPMRSMIEVLPKDELASMAETLVNITAFKRRMAFSSMETVGGPIDVAVISKGDGLVWVKRKHYFPANLNTHFFDNYFKD